MGRITKHEPTIKVTMGIIKDTWICHRNGESLLESIADWMIREWYFIWTGSVWFGLPQEEQDDHGQDVENPHGETEQIDETGHIARYDQEHSYYGLQTRKNRKREREKKKRESFNQMVSYIDTKRVKYCENESRGRCSTIHVDKRQNVN